MSSTHIDDSSISTAESSISNAHSPADRSSFGGDNERMKKLLTVSEKSKVQKEQDTKEDVYQHPSRFIVFFKWFSSIVIGLLFLSCLVLSKLSIIALSNSLSNSTIKNSKFTCSGEYLSQKDVDNARVVCMILVLLLMPNVINFIRGIWLAFFRSDIPWPGKKALLIGLLIGITESFGLCIFVLEVFRMSTAALLSVLTSNCVFIFPVIYYLWLCFKSKWRRENRDDTSSILIFSTLALLMLVAGTVLIIWQIVNNLHPSNKDAKEIWYLPVAILCISLSWIPGIHKTMLEINDSSAFHSVRREIVHDDETQRLLTYSNSSRTTGYGSGSFSSIGGYSNTVSIADQTEVETESHVQLGRPVSTAVYRKTNTTWKLTIWLSFVKILSISIIGPTLYAVRHKYSTDCSWILFNQAWNWESTKTDVYLFLSNAGSSLVGYLLAFLACTTCMQKIAFAIPLFLATPVTFALLYINSICAWVQPMITSEDLCLPLNPTFLISALVCLTLSQICSVGWVVFQSEDIVMQKEDMNESEMRQLLESINRISHAQSVGQRHFESHIFFDGGVNKDSSPTDFALQLIALFNTTLGVDIDRCSKTRTPYGVSLAWKLKADLGHSGMTVKVHLKDNFKVKNKKRWSQVMYMSYVLDFLMAQTNEARADETFILCTDADVHFNANNVEALLDLMTRDSSVGAVCARTHPQGNSPLVWYQTFEYAIGHWFQKAAEHVLGSVLCAPGCFSVYRCSAIKDVLPTYATNVESSFDFLTKDMGEDRWLCTLLVQSGWRIEYCAASENTTHCPEDFDEFYKQRRRWIASTIANLMILIKEWGLIRKFNQRVSVFYLIYQAILLFSTLIGPATVILVVAGGLNYGWNVNPMTTIILQCLICIGFSLFCLYTSQDTQLKVAKFLTFLYSMVMTGVVVGISVQVAKDFHREERHGNITTTDTPTTRNPNAISDDFSVSVTTLYLGIVIAIFTVTGLLHFKELFYLLHGIWYLLCIPSGYLLLTIYSICNITDRSWGTREEKDMSVVTNKTWNEYLEQFLKSVFFCFKKNDTAAAKQTEDDESITEEADTTDRHDMEGATAASLSETVVSDSEAIKVEEWLPAGEIRDKYLHLFQRNGFDTTMFISGMTEKELINIGVKRKGHLKFLLEQIRNLPIFDIEAYVPKKVDAWLDRIGLGEYKAAFKANQIEVERDLEILKSFNRNDIEKEMGISKAGHIKRLLYAIGKLRHPTEGERRQLEVKQKLSVITEHNLKEVNIQEYDFWDRLRKVSLLPGIKAFGLEEELKEKLGGLRNSMLMVLCVSNTLWIILIASLASQADLIVVGSNPIGLAFLVIYSLIFVIQFLCMLVHRVITLSHFLARAPYRCGDGYNSSWSFDDANIMARLPVEDREAYARVVEAYKKVEKKSMTQYRQLQSRYREEPILEEGTV
ncbi:hypothetical protein CHS0354_038027 [Potamilus streckersoni]|uniref:chitin synthase n=1 Tax=Potamilus streckersoni TaxID=2493646 RepID=A0AAE0SRA2_9BIVA|nr:hypothetical protein CHS0354_038027 [Potamilus streckersoni]